MKGPSSPNFRFFRGGQEYPINSSTFTPNKSYAVVIRDDKIVIGEDYLGETAGNHIPLNRDVGGAGQDYAQPIGGQGAGAIRVNADGRIDVSGKHFMGSNQISADRIAAALREAIPGVRLRVTRGRLSDLDR